MTRRKVMKQIERARKNALPLPEVLSARPMRVSVMAMEPDGAASEPAVVVGNRVGQKGLHREVRVLVDSPERFMRNLNDALNKARQGLIHEYTEIVRKAVGG